MDLYGREWDKDNVTPTYNPCSHTHFALANYSNIMNNFMYHIVVNVKSKNDITLSLGGISELSSSGMIMQGVSVSCMKIMWYTLRSYQRILRERFLQTFPNSIMQEYNLNGSKLFPDNLTGRRFVEYMPDNYTFIRFGYE